MRRVRVTYWDKNQIGQVAGDFTDLGTGFILVGGITINKDTILPHGVEDLPEETQRWKMVISNGTGNSNPDAGESHHSA